MKKFLALLLALFTICSLVSTCVFAASISPGDVVGTWYAFRAEDDDGRVYQPPEDIQIVFERDGSSVLTIDRKKTKGTWKIYENKGNQKTEVQFLGKKTMKRFEMVDEELVVESFVVKDGVQHKVLYFSRDAVDPFQLPQAVSVAEEKDFYGEYEKCGVLQGGRYFALENGPDLSFFSLNIVTKTSWKTFVEEKIDELEPMHIKISFAEISITGTEAQYMNQYDDDKDKPMVVMTNFKGGKLAADKWIDSDPITISKLDNGGIRVDMSKAKLAYFFNPVEGSPET